MTEPQTATWTISMRELWGRIERHDFEPGHALDFTGRLARDCDWTLGFARAAILEYRRFCFLAIASPDPVTPSEEVDEVWHLHLTYSSDYWDVWCRSVLRAPLHHDPTRGGPAEDSRHRAQYAATLARYEDFFGPPDPSFWPATHQRFRDLQRFRTIDAERWFLLPRPTALWRRLSNTGRVRWR
jgi:hypothetical protein